MQDVKGGPSRSDSSSSESADERRHGGTYVRDSAHLGTRDDSWRDAKGGGRGGGEALGLDGNRLDRLNMDMEGDRDRDSDRDRDLNSQKEKENNRAMADRDRGIAAEAKGGSGSSAAGTYITNTNTHTQDKDSGGSGSGLGLESPTAMIRHASFEVEVEEGENKQLLQLLFSR